MMLSFDHHRLPVAVVLATVMVGCGGDQYSLFNTFGIDEAVPPIGITPLSRAWSWVMSQRQANWGWGDETPHTILALSLANSTWFTRENLQAQLITKQLQMDLALRLWRHHEPAMSAGVLAVNMMALVALCKDPRSFFSRDLIAILEHKETVVDFEVGFVQLAACTAGRHVRKSRLSQLLDILTGQKDNHAIDTLSVTVLALHCIQQQRRHNFQHYINQAMMVLLKEQDQSGAFGGNLHSTALALQALMASELSGSWNATRAQQYMMSHQRRDGSFGSLFDTNAVLPLLGGRTLLDVSELRCQQPTEQKYDGVNHVGMFPLPDQPLPPFIPSPPRESSNTIDQKINLTYAIWNDNAPNINYNRTFHVPSNTSFLNIMKKAADIDNRYKFSASHWGNGYYIHTLGGQKEKKEGYWFWVLYRFKKDDPKPIYGTKPDTKFIVGTGIQDLILEDGDTWLFYFHKI